MTFSVYVAGASAEITRAERWCARLAAENITVVSTWPENIRKVGRANPTDATRDQYLEWAMSCLMPVSACHVFWMLLPETTTIGMYVELGWAAMLRSSSQPSKKIFGSGPHKPIFTPALVDLHSHYDQEIFDEIVRISKVKP